ncbi:FecR family protein [Steroidobacter sp.]|uniref:FecR family protein n=1 Tax=Steroidobacter sp. TaxID=1978227 RepID=UPI001A603D7F|nr:FecR domain-containing protein [Steroidobacter sp.]MBL8265179.1 FecR domain-containing protein [Steroidobacter sp.]
MSTPANPDPAVPKPAVAEATAVEHDPVLLKAIAEASAWIVTLHGPDRTPGVERGFRCWLVERPMHQYAFEHATDTWNRTRAMVRRSARVEVSVPRGASEQPRKKVARTPLLALVASLFIAVIGVSLYLQGSALKTGIGERRTVVLDDGTQVTMNTATRMTVDYDQQRRLVRLDSGEAFFEVAKRSEWPFVVSVGNREVTALGTAFLVRSDSARVAVTLLEGKVAVTATSESAAAAAITLAPGQRVVFEKRAPPVLDRPEIQKLTAWQQGLVNIDDMTLAQAVEEMNRYSTLQLVVEGPAADIRVSGIFRVTDLENLAQAVAMTHGLDVHRDGRRLVLSGLPQPPSESRFGPAPPKVDQAR